MKIKANRRLRFLIILIFSIFSASVFGNGLNLNSLGSKALSMGGAFVGLANDFSAVYWNPAGIAQFDSKYSGFYLTDVIPSGNYKYSISEMTLVDTNFTKHYFSGLAAYYYPLADKLMGGIGIYAPSNLGSEWTGADLKALTKGKTVDWMSRIGLISISPVVAYKISERLFIGATLNINYGAMELKTVAGGEQYSEESSGWGIGTTLGILAKPNDMISLGLTFKTASKLSFEGEAVMLALPVHLGVSPKSDFERDITWPMWLGGGIAIKPFHNFTLTADIQWTQWSIEDIVITDYKAMTWNIIFRLTPEKEEEMKFLWVDRTQIRFGSEYLINGKIALRGGYYYDPTPVPDETMNILLPSFTFNGITFGLGYKKDRFQLDFGLEYLMGKERKDIKPTEENMPGTYGMNIVIPTISISFKF
ncbi:MAG: outer membrane protein transport protein [Acidobacteriota bacterium]